MENSGTEESVKNKKRRTSANGGTSDAVYGLALIGSAIYFMQHAAGFWEVVLGILKAIVWPAILVYKALEFLKM